MSMQSDEISGAIGNVAVHLCGWVVIGPTVGIGFGAIFAAAVWVAGLDLGLGQCYAAGWAVTSVLFSIEARSCAKRQLTVVNNGGFPPPIPPGGWN